MLKFAQIIVNSILWQNSKLNDESYQKLLLIDESVRDQSAALIQSNLLHLEPVQSASSLLVPTEYPQVLMMPCC
jgi:hypothetical protein